MNTVPTTAVERMTSLQIAELTGKQHYDLMKAIRKMEHSWKEINGGNFSLVEYTDAKGERRPCYSLTKTECLYIATKFNDKARAQLVLRWEELERASRPYVIDFNDPKAVLQLAQNWAEEQEKRAIAERELSEARTQIAEQAPKVVFAEAIMGSKTSCLIGELAKIITQNGYTIGQNRLFDWLRANGYLGKSGEYRNIPNQKYIEQGLFEIKKGTRSGNEGVMHTTLTTKVTPKGQAYFINKFLGDSQSSLQELDFAG